MESHAYVLSNITNTGGGVSLGFPYAGRELKYDSSWIFSPVISKALDVLMKHSLLILLLKQFTKDEKTKKKVVKIYAHKTVSKPP